MHRRPVSISVLGGFLSISSVAVFFLLLKNVFLNESPLYTVSPDGEFLPGSLLVIVALAHTVISFICAVNILDGVNWSRWIYTIACGCFLMWQIYTGTDVGVLMWVGTAFRALVIVYLFLPGANEFFRNPL